RFRTEWKREAIRLPRRARVHGPRKDAAVYRLRTARPSPGIHNRGSPPARRRRRRPAAVELADDPALHRRSRRPTGIPRRPNLYADPEGRRARPTGRDAGTAQQGDTMSNAVATIEQMVYAVEPIFNEVSVDNSISFARE